MSQSPDSRRIHAIQAPSPLAAQTITSGSVSLVTAAGTDQPEPDQTDDQMSPLPESNPCQTTTGALESQFG